MISSVRIFLRLTLLSTCLSIPACGPSKPDPETSANSLAAGAEKNKQPAKPELIGIIASLPRGQNFVLIRRYGSWSATPGTLLTTRGPDSRSANLLMTGESLSEFIAADIQSGAVEIGDGVYSRPTVDPLNSSIAPE